MSSRRDELAVAILQLFQSNAHKTLDKGRFLELDEITSEFDKRSQKDVVKVIKNYLVPIGYLKKIDDTPAYSLTALGMSEVSKQGVSSTINFGNNTNFAYNSPGARQTINVNELEIEVQQLVSEFDKAVNSKDKEKLKKVFGFIADKSVDVAIALITGALVR